MTWAMKLPLVGYRKNTEKMVCGKGQVIARSACCGQKARAGNGEVEVELLFRDGYTKNASEKSLKYADRLRMIITHYKSLKGHVIK